jgi:hypothetical protein
MTLNLNTINILIVRKLVREKAASYIRVAITGSFGIAAN